MYDPYEKGPEWVKYFKSGKTYIFPAPIKPDPPAPYDPLLEALIKMTGVPHSSGLLKSVFIFNSLWEVING